MPSSLLDSKALKVLVVGNGAREHAIAWKLRQSTRVGELLAAPGNAGTAQVATNVPIDAEDVGGVLGYARDHGVDFTVVGPEAPLAAGMVDAFLSAGLTAFGPSREAAKIESSKTFAKALMREHGVPTARARSFDDYQEAVRHVEGDALPVVIKADGLAAGKGVVVARTRRAALEALRGQMVDREYGEAGDTVLVEEYLEGHEISVFAFVDGARVSPMVAACDYKAAGDGDTGPNTGGMGAYSPPPDRYWSGEVEDRIRREIMEPVVNALRDRGSPYVGVLYAGLMMTADGPKVIEFNCRLGDPEAQAVLPRLKTDLLEVMIRAAEGDVGAASLEWDPRPCVAIVLASGGYPGEYWTGHLISGLDEAPPDIQVFHAGTRAARSEEGGGTVSSGGRVLTVSARGSTLDDARRRAYSGVANIGFSDSFYRTDIALPA